MTAVRSPRAGHRRQAGHVETTGSVSDLLLLKDASVRHVVLLLFLIFLPLNSNALGAVVGVGKPVTMALLLGALVLDALYRANQPSPRRPWPGSGGWAVLAAYAGVIAASMALHSFSIDAWVEYLALPLGLFALWVSERTRAGSFVSALLLASTAHLVIAIVTNIRAVGTSGANRLTGGSHPITIGVESGLILVYAVAILLSGRRRVLGIVLALLSGYVMIESMSRTAVLATLVALTALVVAHRRGEVRSRLVVLLGLAPLAVSFLLDDLLRVLAGDAGLQSLLSVTGRTRIWAQVLADFPNHAAVGYGWAPLHGPDGPDAQLYLATGGLSAENSFFAALLMAGVAGLVLFVFIVVRAMFAALTAPHVATGFGVAGATICFAVALVGDGSSGLNYQWWWLLGLFSLGNAIASQKQDAARSDLDGSGRPGSGLTTPSSV